jgi:hypothetical protein
MFRQAKEVIEGKPRSKRRGGDKPYYLEKRLKRGEKSYFSSTNEHEWHKAWGRYKTLESAQEACRAYSKNTKAYYRKFEYRVASDKCMVA